MVSGAQPTGKALLGLTIDTATGKITRKVAITGFRDDPAGESLRPFTWCRDKNVFYYIDANFTADAGVRPAAGREVFLITVDPVAGTAVQTAVTGAKDFPVGMAMGPGGQLIFATESYDGGGGAVVGFDFFTLNMTTAVATRTGSVHRGSSEGDPGYYTGFFRSVSRDGAVAFRLGYKLVTTQGEQGLGSVATNGGRAAAWADLPAAATGHDFYMSIDLVGGSNSSEKQPSKVARRSEAEGTPFSFLSLAPSTYNDFDISLSRVASLTSAHAVSAVLNRVVPITLHTTSC